MTDREKLDQIKDIIEEYKIGTKDSQYYIEQICDVLDGQYDYSNWDHEEKIEVYPNKDHSCSYCQFYHYSTMCCGYTGNFVKPEYGDTCSKFASVYDETCLVCKNCSYSSEDKCYYCRLGKRDEDGFNLDQAKEKCRCSRFIPNKS